MAVDPGPVRVAEYKGPKIVYTNDPGVKIDDNLLRRLQQYVRSRSFLFTPPKSCVLQGGVCVIEIPVVLVKDAQGTDYCVALFPERVSISGTLAGKRNDTPIVWSLIPPKPAQAPGTTFTFFDDSHSLDKAKGILFLDDTQKQMDGAGLGDGITLPADNTKYHVINQHSQKGLATYLPIVVRTDFANTPTPKVSMCGTPDPVIANV